MTAVIRYNAGNVLSVMNALSRIGSDAVLTDDPTDLSRFDFKGDLAVLHVTQMHPEVTLVASGDLSGEDRIQVQVDTFTHDNFPYIVEVR